MSLTLKDTSGKVLLSGDYSSFMNLVQDAVFKDINLSHADFTNMDLSNVEFMGKDISSSNLTATKLTNANVSNATIPASAVAQVSAQTFKTKGAKNK